MIRVQSTSAAADAASAATAAVAGSRHQSVEEVDYAGNRRMSSALSRIQHTISRHGQRILNLARRGQSRGAGSREEVDAVLEDTSIQRVQQAVLHTFSGRIADQDPIDVQNDSITFQLPKNSVPLSEIFDVMERLHRDTSLGIVGYSVSQSTLNQVYNMFIYWYIFWGYYFLMTASFCLCILRQNFFRQYHPVHVYVQQGCNCVYSTHQ